MPSLGNLYALGALIFGSVIAVGMILLKVFSAGKDNQRVKDMTQRSKDEAVVNDSIDQAQQADTRVRDDIAHGRLHDDDGHKRPS